MDERPTLAQALLWALRALWATLPLTLSPLVSSALDRHSAPIGAVTAVGAWGLWLVGLLALFLPRVATLTPVRCLAPLPLALSLWAGVDDGFAGAFGLAIAPAVLVVALALSAPLGDVFVDGSSYGDERRYLLRAPGPLLLGPIPLAWALCVAASISGPLLLAARQWIAGAIGIALGAPLAALAFRSLRSLGQRWLVLVPAGAVLRDHLALAEPTLFAAVAIASIGPAPADDVGLDLTSHALGLAVQLRFHRPLSVIPVPPRGQPAEPCEVSAISFSPSRPGAVVAEAHRRKIGLR
jgi:hypothetical protein